MVGIVIGRGMLVKVKTSTLSITDNLSTSITAEHACLKTSLYEKILH